VEGMTPTEKMAQELLQILYHPFLNGECDLYGKLWRYAALVVLHNYNIQTDLCNGDLESAAANLEDLQFYLEKYQQHAKKFRQIA
jgi:hypothetical protein